MDSTTGKYHYISFVRFFFLASMLFHFCCGFTPIASHQNQYRMKGPLNKNVRINREMVVLEAKEDSNVNKNNEEADCSFRRRGLLNHIFLGSLSAGLAPSLPVQAFFGSNNSGDNKASEDPLKKITTAKDIYGSDIVASKYLASKKAGDRSMVQGLKSEPTFLIVNAESMNLESYALNAECTHLGCVVPWDEFQKKFICPCHGSQYDSSGMVLRGPAPHSLALAHVNIDEENGGKITLSPWIEEDFRTNEKPWWI